MKKECKQSPCLGCTRVPVPELCDNKRCGVWQQWFQGRWQLIHGYYQQRMRGEKS